MSGFSKLLMTIIDKSRRALARPFQTRRPPVAKRAAPPSMPVIGPSSWPEFEMLIAESFRRRGFTVSHSVSGGPDGGWDLVLKKQGLMSLVQCKHWRTRSVGVKAVREFHGVLELHNADGGFLVTAGGVTADARKYAADARIELVDGPRLADMIYEFDHPLHMTQPGTPNSPPCPQCGETMIRKTARRGSSGGAGFWSCSASPKCGGARVERAEERRRTA